LRQTGNDLDLAIDGQGLFALRDANGSIRYTRAGQFQFDTDGTLVSRADGAAVMGMGDDGQFTPLSISGHMFSQGTPTTRLKFSGLLLNDASTAIDVPTPSGTDSLIDIVDATGTRHALGMRLTRMESTDGTVPMTVELMDGTTVVGSGSIVFSNGAPTPESSLVAMTYAPPGKPAMNLTLDFSADVSFFAGQATTLKVDSQDGAPPGSLTTVGFASDGTLSLTYSNGQSAEVGRLALGRLDSPDALALVGDNRFEVVNSAAWHIGAAGEGAFGSLTAGSVELSNVDLSQEFSDLVIMQRGYQASSQIVSTANEMLQQLFSMKQK